MRVLAYLLVPAVLWVGPLAQAEETGLDNSLVGQRFGPPAGMQFMTADKKPFRFADRPFTLLRWWTNACPHCTASLPDLAKLERKYALRGLRFVALYHPKGRDLGSERRMRACLQPLGHRGTIAYDPRWTKLKDLMQRGGLTQATSVTFVVDRAGVVRWVNPGPRIYENADPAWAHAAKSLRELDALLDGVRPSGVRPAPSSAPPGVATGRAWSSCGKTACCA
jgi:thiol-disulfide isomerase/thioredoxin